MLQSDYELMLDEFYNENLLLKGRINNVRRKLRNWKKDIEMYTVDGVEYSKVEFLMELDNLLKDLN